jgi:biopolymer transport protein ExbD
MNPRSANGDVMSELNTTPLIDVMLVLLVMLIITLPIQTHAVKLDMPRVPIVNPPPVVAVALDVDFDGTAVWNGQRMDRTTLDTYLAEAARQNPQPEIHVSANRLAKYDSVAKILADAQRLGVTRIGLVNTEQFAR